MKLLMTIFTQIFRPPDNHIICKILSGRLKYETYKLMNQIQVFACQTFF